MKNSRNQRKRNCWTSQLCRELVVNHQGQQMKIMEWLCPISGGSWTGLRSGNFKDTIRARGCQDPNNVMQQTFMMLQSKNTTKRTQSNKGFIMTYRTSMASKVASRNSQAIHRCLKQSNPSVQPHIAAITCSNQDTIYFS